MSELGCAMDLSSLLREDPPQDWPQGWAPSLLRLQMAGDAVLGVPYHDGPECLVYRRDLFDSAKHRERFRREFGRELAPPKTWEEFHATARFFHGAEEGLSGAAFAAFPDGHNLVYDFLLQLWTRGGELVDAEGNLQFDTPEARAALSFYRDILADKNAMHPDCLALDSVQAGQRFAAGEIAMMVNWFGFATASHLGEDSAVKGCVDVALLPAEMPGKSVSLNVCWLLSLPYGSPHKDVAWAFLRHVLSPQVDLLTTTLGAIGCRRSTWQNDEVNRKISFYHRMEMLHDVAREIPQRKDWPLISCTIDRMLTQATTTHVPVALVLQEAQRAVRG